jgi:hypothetical protein
VRFNFSSSSRAASNLAFSVKNPEGNASIKGFVRSVRPELVQLAYAISINGWKQGVK